MIIQCKIWCYNRKLDEIGLESSMWLDFAFDLNDVLAIKMNGDDDDIDPECTTLYFKGRDDAFVVNLKYNDVLNSFLYLKRKQVPDGYEVHVTNESGYRVTKPIQPIAE